MPRASFLLATVAAGVCAAQACQLISGASATRFAGPAGSSSSGLSGSGTGGAGATMATGGTAGTGAMGGGGAGGQGGCTQASDCTAPGATTCKPNACVNGVCGQLPATAGTSCSDPAQPKATQCNAGGQCVQCLKDGDCGAQQFCSPQQFCRNTGCMDGKKDNQETDVDCGGPDCDPCPNAKGCLLGTDCKSGFCNVSKQCDACQLDNNCPSDGYCDLNDGVCTHKGDNGAACSAGDQCASGNCGEGVCCDVANCKQDCRSCLQAYTSVPNGTCAPVPQKKDPFGACNATAQSTCGAAGQGCNGDTMNPHCIDWDSQTQCKPAGCNPMGTDALGAATCDGSGQCGLQLATPCGAYKCENANCPSSCKSNSDCATGAVCDHTGHCIAPLANGASCVDGNECTSGSCVDGLCCDMACTDACQGCAKALTGGVDGTCADITANTQHAGKCDDTHGMCPGGEKCACNGADVCDDKQGQGCTLGGQCATGHCVDGVCCNAACSGPCDACTKTLGAPNDGTCGTMVVVSMQNPGDCDKMTIAGNCEGTPCTCSANAVCLGDAGAACTVNSQCASNNCLVVKICQ